MSGDISTYIKSAGTKVVYDQEGNLIGLGDLLQPHFSRCPNCSIWDSCKAIRNMDDDGTDTCSIEQAMVITAVNDLIADGVDVDRDHFMIYSFLINMINMERIARMGTRMNFRGTSKENMDTLSKYVAMHAKMDGRYNKALQELLATRKERTKMRQEQASEVSGFLAKMSELAEIARQKRIDDAEASTEDDNGKDID